MAFQTSSAMFPNILSLINIWVPHQIKYCINTHLSVDFDLYFVYDTDSNWKFVFLSFCYFFICCVCGDTHATMSV